MPEPVDANHVMAEKIHTDRPTFIVTRHTPQHFEVRTQDRSFQTKVERADFCTWAIVNTDFLIARRRVNRSFAARSAAGQRCIKDRHLGPGVEGKPVALSFQEDRKKKSVALTGYREFRKRDLTTDRRFRA